MYFKDVKGELHTIHGDEGDYLKKEKLVGSNDYVYLYFDNLFNMEYEISNDVFEALIKEGLVYKIVD